MHTSISLMLYNILALTRSASFSAALKIIVRVDYNNRRQDKSSVNNAAYLSNRCGLCGRGKSNSVFIDMLLPPLTARQMHSIPAKYLRLSLCNSDAVSRAQNARYGDGNTGLTQGRKCRGNVRSTGADSELLSGSRSEEVWKWFELRNAAVC